MSPGEIISLAALLLSLLVTLAGLMLKSKDNQIAELRRQNEALETRVTVANETVNVKQETIDELRRQVDRLTITAEIQERFFSGLPRQLPSPTRGSHD